MSNNGESIIQLSVTEKQSIKPTINKNESKGVKEPKEEKPVVKVRSVDEILKDFYINPDADIYKLDPTFEVCIKGDSKKITGCQSLLAKPIIKFFNNKSNLRKLIPILNSTSRISLRIIDWFVTNYCKTNGTIFNKKLYDLNDKLMLTKWLNNDEKEEYNNKLKKLKELKEDDIKLSSFDNYIIIHNDYKSQLKSYNKKNFDPFCRRDRVNLYYVKGKYISTTIGQLNFFKWAIENYIINYVLDNIIEIEANMAKQLGEGLTTEGEEEDEGEEIDDNDENKSESSNDEQVEITGDKVTGNLTKDKPEINKRIINKKVVKKSGSGKGKQQSGGLTKKNDINIEQEELSKKKQRKRKVIGTKKRKVDKKNVITSNKSMVRHNYPTIINFD